MRAGPSERKVTLEPMAATSVASQLDCGLATVFVITRHMQPRLFRVTLDGKKCHASDFLFTTRLVASMLSMCSLLTVLKRILAQLTTRKIATATDYVVCLSYERLHLQLYGQVMAVVAYATWPFTTFVGF